MKVPPPELPALPPEPDPPALPPLPIEPPPLPPPPIAPPAAPPEPMLPPELAPPEPVVPPELVPPDPVPPELVVPPELDVPPEPVLPPELVPPEPVVPPELDVPPEPVVPPELLPPEPLEPPELDDPPEPFDVLLEEPQPAKINPRPNPAVANLSLLEFMFSRFLGRAQFEWPSATLVTDSFGGGGRRSYLDRKCSHAPVSTDVSLVPLGGRMVDPTNASHGSAYSIRDQNRGNRAAARDWTCRVMAGSTRSPDRFRATLLGVRRYQRRAHVTFADTYQGEPIHGWLEGFAGSGVDCKCCLERVFRG